MQEITFELTDYCPHGCPYCSSSTTTNRGAAKFLPKESVFDVVGGMSRVDRIILSGGEPLAHPDFYTILTYCQNHADDVVVYSNAIRHIAYNANVLDRIRVKVNLTVFDNVERVHVLKGVEQGRARELAAPSIKMSSNWNDPACEATCTHVVVRPDGSQGKPCKKGT